jgi:hypothetical protein
VIGERYVAVHGDVLDAIRLLAMEPEEGRLPRSTVRLLLRCVRLDTVTGNYVFAVSMVRDLDPSEGR